MPDRSPVPPLTVVLGPGHRTPGSRPVLELRGRLDMAVFQAALDRIAADHPRPQDDQLRLRRHGPGHHTLELPAPAGDHAPYPAGLLADLITSIPQSAPETPAVRSGGPPDRPRLYGTLPQTLAVTPRQRELLADAPAGGDHVEQLAWRWHGPLDTRVFTAAWQSVFDRESVLRSAFAWEPHPRAVLFDHCVPEVVRHPHGAFESRDALMARERGRGFDLRRPGLLRVALLDGPARSTTGEAAPTDVLLTYHRALLDGWSVHVLLREFYRAYLAGGALPGGERRPDLRDYTRWLDRQDPSPARDFWRSTAGRSSAALRRAGPGVRTGRDGAGRSRTRLSRAETVRLAHWAARWGATESSALHAVWAMLLYRATGTLQGPLPVGFGVSFSGRGILLDGIEGIPGPFDNPLPMSLEVDPADPVSHLLRTLRDRTLDMAAYEWVSADRIQQWLGRSAGSELAETVVVFEHTPRPDDGLARALAAHGVRVGRPTPSLARTAGALEIVAYHDSQGGLVLTSVHDRERLEDDKAEAMLAQSARLLRRLPFTAREPTTVAEILQSLPGMDVPRMHDSPVSGPLVPLRAAAVPGAATVCLVAAPGALHTWYRELLRYYTGPEAVTSLRTAAEGTGRGAAALRPVLSGGGRLVLGGYSGAGAIAYEIARHIAEFGNEPPLVVLGGGEDENSAGELARALSEAAAGT